MRVPTAPSRSVWIPIISAFSLCLDASARSRLASPQRSRPASRTASAASSTQVTTSSGESSSSAPRLACLHSNFCRHDPPASLPYSVRPPSPMPARPVLTLITRCFPIRRIVTKYLMTPNPVIIIDTKCLASPGIEFRAGPDGYTNVAFRQYNLVCGVVHFTVHFPNSPLAAEFGRSPAEYRRNEKAKRVQYLVRVLELHRHGDRSGSRI